MRKIFIGFFSLFVFSTVLAKIDMRAVEREVKRFESELEVFSFMYLGSKGKEQSDALGVLKDFLPSGPEKFTDPEDFKIEKDVFSGDIGKNNAAVKILQEQLMLLEQKKRELQTFLRQQQQVKRGWDVFSHSSSKQEWEEKMREPKKETVIRTTGCCPCPPIEVNGKKISIEKCCPCPMPKAPTIK